MISTIAISIDTHATSYAYTFHIYPNLEIRGLAFVEVTLEDFDGCAS